MNRTWKILICICMALLCLLTGSGAVSAQGTESNVERGEQKPVYQLAPEEEAAIVHDIPLCPVIIDGVKYEPEEIRKFDGHRLWFTVDFENNLYAFTTEKGIDAFHQKQREIIAESKEDLRLLNGYSEFYEDASYGGTMLALLAGYYSSLGTMDDAISSFKLDDGIYKASLFEDAGYGGDVFERVGGTSISSLWIFGWNDRASSLIVYP